MNGQAAADLLDVFNSFDGSVIFRGLTQSVGGQAPVLGRIGWIFNLADVVLAPTTAQPPLKIDAFDQLSGLATDRTMIRACPATWAWNLLGWPSINVPAGFTSDGLPIGVQLMGPANSEPLLVSLAAALEAINGWASREPEIWWDTRDRTEHEHTTNLSAPHSTANMSAPHSIADEVA